MQDPRDEPRTYRDPPPPPSDSYRDYTSATPPPNARVFVGNLASEKVSRAELVRMFAKYGNIVEDIVIRKSYGFVQYDSPDSARAAIQGETGKILGGLRLDLNLADGRKRTRDERSFRDDYDHRRPNNTFDEGSMPPHRDFKRQRSGSPHSSYHHSSSSSQHHPRHATPSDFSNNSNYPPYGGPSNSRDVYNDSYPTAPPPHSRSDRAPMYPYDNDNNNNNNNHPNDGSYFRRSPLPYNPNDLPPPHDPTMGGGGGMYGRDQPPNSLSAPPPSRMGGGRLSPIVSDPRSVSPPASARLTFSAVLVVEGPVDKKFVLLVEKCLQTVRIQTEITAVNRFDMRQGISVARNDRKNILFLVTMADEQPCTVSYQILKVGNTTEGLDHVAAVQAAQTARSRLEVLASTGDVSVEGASGGGGGGVPPHPSRASPLNYNPYHEGAPRSTSPHPYPPQPQTAQNTSLQRLPADPRRDPRFIAQPPQEQPFRGGSHVTPVITTSPSTPTGPNNHIPTSTGLPATGIPDSSTMPPASAGGTGNKNIVQALQALLTTLGNKSNALQQPGGVPSSVAPPASVSGSNDGYNGSYQPQSFDPRVVGPNNDAYNPGGRGGYGNFDMFGGGNPPGSAAPPPHYIQQQPPPQQYQRQF